MATISNVIKWVSNIEEFRTQIKSGVDQVVALQSSVEKTVRSLSGEGLLRAANNAAAAVQQLGGVTKLTAVEKERLNTLIGKAIDKYTALGQTAPSALIAIEAETRKIPKPTEEAGLSVGKLAASYVTAQIALDVFKAGMRTLTNFVRDSISAYAEAEAAQVKLTAALRAQGNATPEIIDQYNRLAGQFQQTTVFSDDLVNEIEALFVEVGDVGPKQMERALSAATNLSAGLGIDLQRATMLVAKAMEGNTGALKRYGVAIDSTAVAARGADVVFDAIQKKFGGQAIAQADTYTGRIQMMGNAWNNFQEAVGKALVDDPSVREFLRTATDLMNALSGSTENATTSVGRLVQAWRTFQETVNPGLKIKREQDELNDLINTTNEQVTALNSKFREMQSPLAAMLEGQLGVGDQLKANWAAAQEALAKYDKESDEARRRAEEYAKAVQNLRDQFSGAKLLLDLREVADAWRGLSKAQQEDTKTQDLLIKSLDPIVQRFGPSVLPANLRATRDAYMTLNVAGIDVNKMIADQIAKERTLFDAKSKLIVLAAAERASMIALPLKETSETYQVMGETIEFVIDQQRRLKDETEEVKRKFDEARARAFGPYIAALEAASSAIGHFSQAGGQAIAVVSQLASSIEKLGEKTATTGEKVSAGASGIMSMIALYQTLDKIISDAQHRRDVFNARSQIQENLGLTISPNLSEAFATEGLTRYRDQLRELGRIVADVGGVTAFNIAKIQKATLDMLNTVSDAYRRHVISAEDMAAQLNVVFPQLAAVATANGSIVSKSFLDIIAAEEKLGLQTQAVTDYLKAQITSALGGLEGFLSKGAAAYEALAKAQEELTKPGADIAKVTAEIEKQQKIIDAVGITSQASAAAFGAALGGSFQRLLDRGVSFTEALKMTLPAAQALKAQLEATGLSGGEAFAKIERQLALANDKVAGPALDAVNSLGQSFVGLFNSGTLTEAMFTGMASQVAATRDTLVSLGNNGDAVLEGMQPTLQTIWELWKDTGFAVDEATQKLLEDAEAANLVGEQYRTAQEKMAKTAERTADAVEAIARMLGAIPNAANNAAAGIEGALRRLPSRIDIPVVFTPEGDTGIRTPREGTQPELAATGGLVSSAGKILQFAQGGVVPPQRFDHGGQVARILDFTPKGTDRVPALLTPGEIILNAAQQAPVAAAIARPAEVNTRGGDVTFNISVDARGASIDTPERPQQLARELAREIVKTPEFVAEFQRQGLRNANGLRTAVRRMRKVS